MVPAGSSIVNSSSMFRVTSMSASRKTIRSNSVSRQAASLVHTSAKRALA